MSHNYILWAGMSLLLALLFLASTIGCLGLVVASPAAGTGPACCHSFPGFSDGVSGSHAFSLSAGTDHLVQDGTLYHTCI